MFPKHFVQRVPSTCQTSSLSAADRWPLPERRCAIKSGWICSHFKAMFVRQTIYCLYNQWLIMQAMACWSMDGIIPLCPSKTSRFSRLTHMTIQPVSRKLNDDPQLTSFQGKKTDTKQKRKMLLFLFLIHRLMILTGKQANSQTGSAMFRYLDLMILSRSQAGSISWPLPRLEGTLERPAGR